MTKNLVSRVIGEASRYYYVGLVPNLIASHAIFQGFNGARSVSSAVIVAGLNLAVGRHKFSEYKEVRSALERFGWDERIVKPKMYSWCQRHAARQAATELGYQVQFDDFAKSEGHEWYHFLPKVHRFGELSQSLQPATQLSHTPISDNDIYRGRR